MEEQKLKSLAEELKEKMKEPSVEAEPEPTKDSEDISKEEKISPEEPKKEVIEKKSISSKEETLIPLEDYIKCAVHLGTKVITPHMRKFVYKRRADGLAVINTILIDKQLRESIDFIIKYDPKDIYLSCKR